MEAVKRVPNPEQQAVIDELDRNIILFASAGTGKTFSVACRVGNIIASGKAQPAEILCLTFTIKAADEMRDDITVYAGEAAKGVTVSTIHSFAYQTLKEEYVRRPEYYTLPTVCDETEAFEIAARVLEEQGLKAEETSVYDHPGVITGIIGALKQQRELLQVYTDDEAADFQEVYRHIREACPDLCRKTLAFYDYRTRQEGEDRSFAKLLKDGAGSFLHGYCEELRKSDKLDFDDLICMTHRLLREPEPRAYWQQKYRYIIIDEMQDTSELEYDMLRQLFPGNRIMMCGDFFQTIYQWRGSNPEKVLGDYVRDYHACRFMLTRNYRSTRLLTQASFGYLRNTFPELMGKYCPAQVITESKTAGEPILNIRAGSHESGAAWIYNYLEANRPEDPTKVCIMCRTNPHIDKLYQALTQIGSGRADGQELRFFTVESGMKFFRRPVIRDVLAFYRILVNRTDSEAFRRLAERYVSGVGKQTLRKIQEQSELGLFPASYADPDLYRYGDPYYTLIEAYRRGNVVVYDTETTGLDLEKDQAFQISAVRLGPDGEITDTLDQMMIPTREISAAARATHHQTMETIKARGAISIREGLENFLRFCRGAVLVGHNNLAFDSPLVRRQLKENGLPQPDVRAEYDTLVLAHQLLPKSVNHKLETMCSHFGIVNEAAHDALGDITATGKVLGRFLRDAVIPQTMARMQALDEFRPKFEKLFAFLQKLRTEYLEKNDISGMTHEIAKVCLARADNREKTSRPALEDFLYTVDHTETGDGTRYLLDIIRDSALSGSQIDLLIRKLKKIPIITVHQSKGCEFDTVIIADADDSSYPTYQAQRNNTENEEKRVFYVAISRAKERLILVSASQAETYYGFRRNDQSRYIAGIPEECVVTRTVN